MLGSRERISVEKLIGSNFFEFFLETKELLAELLHPQKRKNKQTVRRRVLKLCMTHFFEIACE